MIYKEMWNKVLWKRESHVDETGLYPEISRIPLSKIVIKVLNIIYYDYQFGKSVKPPISSYYHIYKTNVFIPRKSYENVLNCLRYSKSILK